jgi:hypothetical protein
LHAQLNNQIVCSPPSTGLVVLQQSIGQTQQNSVSATSSSKNKGGNNISNAPVNGNSSGSSVVVNALYAKLNTDPTMEAIADDLALIVSKQTDKSVDKFSSGETDYSAVVSFKPFEGSIYSR